MEWVILISSWMLPLAGMTIISVTCTKRKPSQRKSIQDVEISNSSSTETTTNTKVEMNDLDPVLNWYDNARLYPEDPNKFNPQTIHVFEPGFIISKNK